MTRRADPPSKEANAMALGGNQSIFGLRLTIFIGGGDLREGSDLALTMRFADGYETSFSLNDGCRWESGSTHQVTIDLPDAPLAKDLAAIGVSFTSGPGTPHNDWVMSGFGVEALVDGSTWLSCVDEVRTPHIQRFTKHACEWSTAFVYTSEYALKAARATVQRRTTIASARSSPARLEGMSSRF